VIHRCRLHWLLLVASLACGRSQRTTLLHPDAGVKDDPSNAPAVPFDAGSIGDASVELVDAGNDDRDAGRSDAGDASTNALPGLLDGQCVEGTLEEQCPGERCPARADALASQQASGASIVVQRPCRGDDGRAFVSVGSSFGTSSGTLIYDAETDVLVSVYGISDFPEYCDNRSIDVFYGPIIPDCKFEYPDATIPSICYEFRRFDTSDGGLVELPTPDECVFVEE
jgi:hypothetical protein